MFEKLSLEQKRVRWIISLFLLLIALVFWFKPQSLGWLFADDSADKFFKQSMLRVASLYALSAGVNGIVSVVQDSEIEAAPAGVGLSIAAGEALDPINDLAERLSDTMLTVMALLGVEKLIHDILGEVLFLKVVALLLLLGIISLYVNHQRALWLRKLMKKIILILLPLRLVLATAFLVEGLLNEHFFEAKIQPHQSYLIEFKQDFENQMAEGEEASFLTKGKMTKEYMSQVWKQREQLSYHLLQLAVWSLSILTLQILILPVSIWLLLRYLVVTIANSSQLLAKST